MTAKRFLVCVGLGGVLTLPPVSGALREAVHPRRNVETFAPVEARFVRFIIHATNKGEPCLDELEIYSPEDQETRNRALAAAGARATASGSLPGYQIHQIEGINDGRYGNGWSWIADRRAGAWVQIELPQPVRISRIVWSRDREGKFIDRLATQYEIQVALQPGRWQTVASSEDREPLGPGAELSGSVLSITRRSVNRFAPVSTSLSPEAERASTEYAIDAWQTSDGLPGNTITGIQQTPDGYLWIATLNGLARFDGVQFRIFGEESGVTNTRLLCLLVDRKGTLWTGTDGGGLLRRESNGRFRAFRTRDGLPHDTVTSLSDDAAGRLWIGTASGLACWRDGRLTNDPATWPVRGRQVSGVVPRPDGSLWYLLTGALLASSGTNLIQPPVAREPSSFTTVFAVHEGLSGLLWFGGANGYVGVVSNDTVMVFPEQPGQLLGTIWELRETRNRDLWIGTAEGGLRRLRDRHFTSLTTQEGLSENSVRCLYEDREGTLWVGTVGGGLNRIKPRKLRTFTTRDGLAHNVVMSLAEDAEGDLWVGSNCGGLSVRRHGAFAPFTGSYLLDNECLWSLLSMPDGALYVGTWGDGLFRVRGRELEHFVLGGAGEEIIGAMCAAKNGGVWVGTAMGTLARFVDGRFQRVAFAPGMPRGPVSTLLEEPSGELWMGTSSGGALLKFVDGAEPAHAIVTAALTRQQGLPSDVVRTFFRDARGALWIGTAGGLARWAGGRMATFTREQGLPDDVISQILEDDRGRLWIGCNQGIFCVRRRDLEEIADKKRTRVNPVAYGRSEGMESLECTGGFDPAGLKTRDGKLWFSTVKGLVMADPASIVENSLPPPVHLEQILVDGRPMPLPDMAASGRADGLRIGPGTPRVEFRFTALSLVAPERNRFQYRLEGLDANWVEAGGQRAAVYAHLPAGHYTFRVRASNNDGVWNEVGASCVLQVLPPFWATWWFVTGTAALVLGGGGWGVRRWSVRRLRRRLEQVEREHALAKDRARIAQDIHDELGAALTRITLLSELGQRHRQRAEDVGADLDKIAVAAREAVRAVDAIVWAVNPRNDSLDHFANYVCQFAEDFLRLTSIRCRLDVPANLPEIPLSTETRHHLYLAVKEALNNVVRHSGASEVCLRVACSPGGLTVMVEDNGRGLAQAEGEPGHDGLGNLRRRLAEVNGRCDIESAPGQGTRIRLHVPLSTHEHPHRYR